MLKDNSPLKTYERRDWVRGKRETNLSTQNITDNILMVHETQNTNKGLRMESKPEKWLSFRLMKVEEIGNDLYEMPTVYLHLYFILVCFYILRLIYRSKNTNVPDESTSSSRLWFLWPICTKCTMISLAKYMWSQQWFYLSPIHWIFPLLPKSHDQSATPDVSF